MTNISCRHIVTRAHCCVDCGVKVYDVETKPCGDCAHFSLWLGEACIGSCSSHLMTVTSGMFVTFKVKDGSCFKSSS